MNTNKNRTEMTHMENVLRGAALLDTYFDGHGDWRKRINIKDLDMSDTSLCVLAQVFADAEHDTAAWFYGQWGVGMRRLFGSTSEEYSVPNGFEVPHLRGKRDYAGLRAAWVEYLTQ